MMLRLSLRKANRLFLINIRCTNHSDYYVHKHCEVDRGPQYVVYNDSLKRGFLLIFLILNMMYFRELKTNTTLKY